MLSDAATSRSGSLRRTVSAPILAWMAGRWPRAIQSTVAGG